MNPLDQPPPPFPGGDDGEDRVSIEQADAEARQTHYGDWRKPRVKDAR